MRRSKSTRVKREAKKSTANFYFASSNAMPNMSASSAVILTRYWVISGRIRPFLYTRICPHFHLSMPLVLAPATIIYVGNLLSFSLRQRLTFSYPTIA